MNFTIKHFQELTTNELYEILKTRSEIFVVEQDCVYQDLDDKDQDAYHIFCKNEAGRVAACLRVFSCEKHLSGGSGVCHWILCKRGIFCGFRAFFGRWDSSRENGEIFLNATISSIFFINVKCSF